MISDQTSTKMRISNVVLLGYVATYIAIYPKYDFRIGDNETFLWLNGRSALRLCQMYDTEEYDTNIHWDLNPVCLTVTQMAIAT